MWPRGLGELCTLGEGLGLLLLRCDLGEGLGLLRDDLGGWGMGLGERCCLGEGDTPVLFSAQSGLGDGETGAPRRGGAAEDGLGAAGRGLGWGDWLRVGEGLCDGVGEAGGMGDWTGETLVDGEGEGLDKGEGEGMNEGEGEELDEGAGEGLKDGEGGGLDEGEGEGLTGGIGWPGLGAGPGLGDEPATMQWKDRQQQNCGLTFHHSMRCEGKWVHEVCNALASWRGILQEADSSCTTACAAQQSQCSAGVMVIGLCWYYSLSTRLPVWA